MMSFAESLRTARKFVKKTRSERAKSAKFIREKPKQKKMHRQVNKESGAKAAKESTLEFLRKRIRRLHKNIIIRTRIWARKQSNIIIFCLNIKKYSRVN